MGKSVLTARAVAAAKPGPARQEIADAGQPGLYLVVQPSGAKSWAVRYRFDGRTRKLTLGPVGAVSLATAREKARAATGLLEKGVDPTDAERQAEVAERERKAATVAAMAAEFIERYARRRNRTWRETEANFRRYVTPAVGEKPITELRRRDVLRIVDGLVDTGRPYAAVQTLAAVRKLLAWCLEREIVETNVAAGIKTPVRLQPRERTLFDDEIKSLWQVATAGHYPFAPYVQLLLLTGCRKGELAGLQWSDIDVGGRLITIPSERYKTGIAHAVPLSAQAMGVIAALPKFDGPYVFSTTGGAKPISGFTQMKAHFDRKLPEPLTYTLHDLRRTVRTGMSRLKIPPHIAERVLGHVQRGIERHYDHWHYLDEKRAALEAWGRHVEAVVTGEAANNVVEMGARR